MIGRRPLLPDLRQWSALPHLERAIARLLEFDPDTRATLAAMHGRVVELDIEGLPGAVFLFPGEQGLGLRREHEGEVHVRIRSTVGGLMKLAGARLRDEPVPAGVMDLSGDLGTAQQVQQILSRLDIDWEEMTARLLGDTAARKLGLLLRDGRAWLLGAAQSMAANASEYLRYEIEAAAERDQVEAFMHDVDTLRGDVDRLEVRIRRLRERRGLPSDDGETAR